MKNLLFIIAISLITACSGSTHIASKEISVKAIISDSISEEIKPLKQTPNIEIPQKIINEKNNTLVNKIIEVFNHSLWDDLLKKHVSQVGFVNYKALKKNRVEVSKYIVLLSENTPKDSWTKADKLAYWINAYNALTIDLILRNYPIKSIKDIKDPWGQRLWKLGGKWYNLEDIEHQILRKMDEPRIHFAIVCASLSCPKLWNEAYSAQNLETQLNQATNDFLSDPKRNILTENKLFLSQIFQWFSNDFTQQGTIIDFLNKYSDVKISNNAKKTFKDYNWDLNE